MAVVDTLVHPIASDRAIRAYLPEVWKKFPLPKPEHNVYPPPFGEYHPDIEMTVEENVQRKDGLGKAGTTKIITPAQVRRDLFGAGGVIRAILLPLTRGIQPDPDMDHAIAQATNDWLAETWLSKDANPDGRFKGSIRVTPRHPAKAAREIERWAKHPHMVQVAVPLQATTPYGDPMYWPVWEAAAKHGLPVVVRADTGSGIEPTPSAVGFPLTTYAMHVLQPYNGLIHLVSLVMQGVFARYPSHIWVFADGAFDAFAPILWRLNNEWRESRFQTPWIEHLPSDFLPTNVRLVLRSCDANSDDVKMRTALELAQAEKLLMYGSGYPFWDRWTAGEAGELLPPQFGDAVFRGNAETLYRLT